MPQKTIYVSDEDWQFFEEAKSLGEESLSRTIANAVRNLVVKKREFEREKKEHNLCVGEKKISFVAEKIFDLKVAPKRRKVRRVVKEGFFSHTERLYEMEQPIVAQREEWQIFLSEKGGILVWWDLDGAKDYCILEKIEPKMKRLKGNFSGKEVEFSVREQFFEQFNANQTLRTHITSVEKLNF